MRNALPPRFGEPIYRYDTVTSTQDVAREWAEKGAKPGTVITARAMTAGRGRQGRKWEVPPGANVCLTAVCPPVAASETWRVALAAGVAVVEALRAVAPAADARIRFPNDVYAGNRKLAGVLVETIPAPGGKLLPLLGIGVNVRAAALPPDLAARAISLEEASGVPCDVPAAEEAVLFLLTAVWNRWRGEGFASVLELWRKEANLALPRVFVLNGAEGECRVADVSPNGIVTVINAEGECFALPAAQIIFGDG